MISKYPSILIPFSASGCCPLSSHLGWMWFWMLFGWPIRRACSIAPRDVRAVQPVLSTSGRPLVGPVCSISLCVLPDSPNNSLWPTFRSILAGHGVVGLLSPGGVLSVIGFMDAMFTQIPDTSFDLFFGEGPIVLSALLCLLSRNHLRNLQEWYEEIMSAVF